MYEDLQMCFMVFLDAVFLKPIIEIFKNAQREKVGYGYRSELFFLSLPR